MRKWILVICLPLWLQTSMLYAQSVWYQQNSGTSAFLNGVSFTDPNTGTVVGDSGIILRTTDGGTTWTRQASGTSAWLMAVSFIDRNTGTAVGRNGTILRTVNGGETWTIQPSGVPNANLHGVSFTNLNIGFAVGNLASGIILRTTNGGSTWTNQQIGFFTTILAAVSFADPNTGTVVGTWGVAPNFNSIIWRTTDGGDSWTDWSVEGNNYHLGVCFIDSNTGTVVGTAWDGSRHQGTILRTTNSGATWVSQFGISDTTGVVLKSVSFVSANMGVAVGGRYPPYHISLILRTTDGGNTWVDESIGTSVILNGVSCPAANTAIAVGLQGTILRRRSSTTQVETRNTDMPHISLTQNYPNPFNPTTEIVYRVKSRESVSLKVYDLLGREVATLVNEVKNPGEYRVQWDGGGLPSGVYFYKLSAGSFTETKKLVMMR